MDVLWITIWNHLSCLEFPWLLCSILSSYGFEVVGIGYGRRFSIFVEPRSEHMFPTTSDGCFLSYTVGKFPIVSCVRLRKTPHYWFSIGTHRILVWNWFYWMMVLYWKPSTNSLNLVVYVGDNASSRVPSALLNANLLYWRKQLLTHENTKILFEDSSTFHFIQ